MYCIVPIMFDATLCSETFFVYSTNVPVPFPFWFLEFEFTVPLPRVIPIHFKYERSRKIFFCGKVVRFIDRHRYMYCTWLL
jgi:hypothetical protein